MIGAVYFVIINRSEKRILRAENIILNRQNELQYEYYLTLQQQEKDIHKLYHDIGNHISTIQILIENGDKQIAEDYISNIIDSYLNSKRDYFCSIGIINSVLLQKKNICGINDIIFHADVQIPQNLSIHEIDLMTIFSDLLDMVIKECQTSVGTEKFIKIQSFASDNYFAINIASSKSKEILIEKKNSLSVWKELASQQYQLLSVEKILMQYKGQKEQKENEEETLITVSFPIKQ